MFHVLIADSLPDDIISRYNQSGNLRVDNRVGISGDELREILSEYDGLVVRSRTRVTADVLQHAGKLKIIGRAGAGVDNIDIVEATRRGIIVMNTPGGNTIAATEHTLALMLCALRNVPQAYSSLHEQKWDRKSFMGRELYEKTVGIIGLGKIGREVARRLTAFGAKLIGYDPILTTELADKLGVELLDFEELLRRADIITIHAPRMPETMNMINAEKLKLCKDGVVLVNCARGGLVNEDDLLAALNSGKVAVAACDVFENEPPRDWRLIRHPRLIATPHLGASTEEAQIKVADLILRQMLAYFTRNVAHNAVNFVSVEETVLPIISPYFELARRIGVLFSQIRAQRLKEVAIGFYGEVIKLPDEPIASYLMMGALKASPFFKEKHDVDLINPVNSLAVAREKGIAIELVKRDHPLTSHTNLISCNFRTEGETIHLAGTVYARDLYRLIKFGRFDVDADLSGKMVIVENRDVPGIIGKVGTILGNANINISHLSSGRILDEKLALNIFNVEGQLGPALQQQLASIPNVLRILLPEIKA